MRSGQLDVAIVPLLADFDRATIDRATQISSRTSSSSSFDMATLDELYPRMRAAEESPAASLASVLARAGKSRPITESPAYVPKYVAPEDQIIGSQAGVPPPPERVVHPGPNLYTPHEAEYSLRSMDYLYSASFHDYIKNEENVACVARHLDRIIRDYPVRTVANGLRWLVKGWDTTTTIRLLRFLVREMTGDAAALMVALVVESWPSCSLDAFEVIVGVLRDEQPETAALFVRVMTEAWPSERAEELSQFLEASLDWDDETFVKFNESVSR